MQCLISVLSLEPSIAKRGVSNMLGKKDLFPASEMKLRCSDKYWAELVLDKIANALHQADPDLHYTHCYFPDGFDSLNPQKKQNVIEQVSKKLELLGYKLACNFGSIAILSENSKIPPHSFEISWFD